MDLRIKKLSLTTNVYIFAATVPVLHPVRSALGSSFFKAFTIGHNHVKSCAYA